METVLSTLLFTLYTSDFSYNSELCYLQRFSDDSAIVGCTSVQQEKQYRGLVDDLNDLLGGAIEQKQDEGGNCGLSQD